MGVMNRGKCIGWAGERWHCQRIGMGFKDLWDFNSTMLTITTWRLKDNQTKIWSQVINGLYYPRWEFIKARKWARPSWAWTSILHGRDVLDSHGIWQVGNGRRIRVFNDAWVPGMSGPSHLEQLSSGNSSGYEGWSAHPLNWKEMEPEQYIVRHIGRGEASHTIYTSM